MNTPDKWKITVILERRGDGGLRVCSDDLPGLILSGADPQKVAADIPTAIQVLLEHRKSK